MTSATGRPDGGSLPLAVAFGAAPAAWFAHLLVSYLLVPIACDQGSMLLLHLTTAATALVAAGGGAVAARSWKRARESGGGGFLFVAGLSMSPLFLLLILIGGASPLLIGPCAG